MCRNEDRTIVEDSSIDLKEPLSSSKDPRQRWIGSFLENN